MKPKAQLAHEAAASKASYHRRKARGEHVARAATARYRLRKVAGLCVTCEASRDPAAGDTGTQCRGCADYRNERQKERRAA